MACAICEENAKSCRSMEYPHADGGTYTPAAAIDCASMIVKSCRHAPSEPSEVSINDVIDMLLASVEPVLAHRLRQFRDAARRG